MNYGSTLESLSKHPHASSQNGICVWSGLRDYILCVVYVKILCFSSKCDFIACTEFNLNFNRIAQC